MTRFRYGAPSAEEWKGPWKSSPSDPDFDQFDVEVAQRLASEVDKLCSRPGEDFYLRGDFYIPDRTEYLEILRPSALTPQLVNNLVKILQKPLFEQWRVVIVTYLGDAETPIVYPAGVRFGRALTVMPMQNAISDIVARMQEKLLRDGKSSEDDDN